MRKIALSIILIYLFSLVACDMAESPGSSTFPENEGLNVESNKYDNGNSNTDSTQTEKEFLNLDFPTFKRNFNWQHLIINGKPQDIYKLCDWPSELTDALYCTDAANIVYLSNGKFVRTLDKPEYPVQKILNELEETKGIRDIEFNQGGMFCNYFSILLDMVVYTEDGYAYELDFDSDSIIENRVYKCEKIRYGYRYGRCLLNSDGTVSCEYFPETEQWTDIIDFAVCEDYIIGLTSNGNMVSVGIDFTAENIVKIDLMEYPKDDYYGFCPIALTSDGTFIFPKDYPVSLYKQVVEASGFTDVMDFIIFPDTGSEGCIILAKKSDGSLIATTNKIYNPEYVSQPE